MYASLTGSDVEDGLPAFFHFLKALERICSAWTTFFGDFKANGFFEAFVSKVSLAHLTRRSEYSEERRGIVSGASQYSEASVRA